MKRCSKCKLEKPFSEYYTATKRKDGKQNFCKDCGIVWGQEWANKNREKRNGYSRKWAANNLDKIKDAKLQKDFDITLDQYKQMLERQNGVCEICKQKCSRNEYLCVDHCHTTGEVRGLLCDNCNVGLGRFQDNTISLVEAADYLNKYDRKLRLVKDENN